MTREELLELIAPQMTEAKKKLELSPNAPYIFVENSITYIGSDFEEHEEYNEHDDTALLASLTVCIRDRYGEDDPNVSFSMSFELKHSTVMDPGSIEDALSEFMKNVDELSAKLDAAENSDDVIISECKKQEEETLELIADMEKHFKKLRRFCYFAIGGVILAALAALIFVAIVK
jgi:hypothetical protein